MSIELWERSKLGKFTASKISKIVGDKKGYQTYLFEKAAEIITGLTEDTFTSYKMEWGNEQESHAAKLYGDNVPNVEGLDYIYHGVSNPKFYPYSEISGASPDAVLTQYDQPFKIVEFKCPDTKEHVKYSVMDLDYFKDNKKEYYWQCVMGMMSVNVTECDFVSYDPRPKFNNMTILNFNLIKEDADTLKTRLQDAEKDLTNILSLYYKKKGYKCAS